MPCALRVWGRMLREHRGENWTHVRADNWAKTSQLRWKSPGREEGTGFLKQKAKHMQTWSYQRVWCPGVFCDWKGGMISWQCEQCNLQETWKMSWERWFVLICEAAWRSRSGVKWADDSSKGNIGGTSLGERTMLRSLSNGKSGRRPLIMQK